jgi:signal transduction histidine kinase/DNA-binding response OmpR family regulator
MIDVRALSILTLRLRHERHVVHARQRARDIAALLGFEHQEQIRLATAASELARNAFRYASNGVVEFLVRGDSPQLFVLSVTDSGPGIANLSDILDGKYVSKTGLGKGIVGTRRLMDRFEITSSPGGTFVEAGKNLPVTAPHVDAERVRWIAIELAKSSATDPFDEIERQNQELLKTLAELRENQDQLAELNHELENTNRGVVALYAELDQNADDLRRVSDLKSSFLSNLSHEFRTPLNSIASLCQLLIGRSDGELSSEQEKQVNYIQRSAAELTELVDDLLDLAKVEAGKVDVRPRHFEVQDLFGALRGMLKPLLSGNSLELIFDAEPNLPILYTDEGKVSQILRNLISNALKFTRRGHVRLTAHLEESSLIVFRVADTGIGIAPEDQARIFEEFVQIESEMQTRVKGTGLGLPLSKRLAQMLGGSLSVQSELGVGSTFQVLLPIHFGTSEARSPDAASDPHPNAKGPAILFIEDNPETRFVHESSLKMSQYRPVFAMNVPEARVAMRAFTPALVALDRFLDGEDSLFYIQEMKANGYSGPVVVISVVDDEEAVLSAGANRFLSKPVPPFKLVGTIRELVEDKTSNTLLLTDDDEVTRYLLGEALTKLGYNVIEARNGREAIQLLGRHILNGVFLDVMMPELNGFEVLREIRRSSHTQEIPVIIHTSKDLSPEELDELSALGAVLYPKREFSSDEGSEKLQELLKFAGMA